MATQNAIEAKRAPVKVKKDAPSRSKSTSMLMNGSHKKVAPTKNIGKSFSDNNLASKLESLSLNSRKRSTQVRSRNSSASSRCKTLDDVAAKILSGTIKNIVVMAGAGASTGSGIPDFRTPGTGLYYNLKQYNIPKAESIFDIEYFKKHPKPFYTIAKELYPTGKYRPNYTHYFLRLLHEKKILNRIYTQNIDGLEKIAGIPSSKIIEAHGSFEKSSCIECKTEQNAEEVKCAIFNSKIPRCSKKNCFGLVKPDIVFFGEDLPKKFYYYMRDFPQADMLIVIGTSLQVEPFAGIVNSTRFPVPRILFNKKAVGPFLKGARINDVVAAGDIIRNIRILVEKLGWKDELDKLIRSNEPDYDSSKEIVSSEEEVSSRLSSASTTSSCSSAESSHKKSFLLKRPTVTNTFSNGATRKSKKSIGQSRRFQSQSAQTAQENSRYSSVRTKGSQSLTTVTKKPAKGSQGALPRIPFRQKGTSTTATRLGYRQKKEESSDESSEGSDDSSDDSDS